MRYVGIDPSTKTGLVIIDEEKGILFEDEIISDEEHDPERMIDIAKQLLSELERMDTIVIEGFSYQSKGKGVSFQYGIGWIIRSMLVENKFSYIEVPPTVVKKFATGNGNCSKPNMILPIFKTWGYEHDSDNVRDAFVMAQIAKALAGKDTLGLTKVQKQVLKTIKE